MSHDDKMNIFKRGTPPGDAEPIRIGEPPTGPVNKFCERPGCKARGHFGFGRPGQLGGEMHWYCGDHRADGEATRRA